MAANNGAGQQPASIGRKTGLPSQLEAGRERQQQHEPNIIGNAPPKEDERPIAATRKRHITVQEMENVAVDKKTLYDSLTVQAQLYLPPIQVCSMDFMRLVLSGGASVLQNHEVSNISCPKYREITVQAVFAMVVQVPRVYRYIPQDIDEDRIPRVWLFNVVNTLVPTFFPRILDKAESNRQTARKEDEMIVLDQKMYDLLRNFKLGRFDSKKGRLSLLKKKVKKRKRPEFEKKHDLGTTIAAEMGKDMEQDVFQRAYQAQQMQRLKHN